VKAWLCAAALVLAAAPACGSNSQATNPCSYVSASDVSSVVGGSVTDGVLTTETTLKPGDTATTCLFRPHGSFVVDMPASNADFQFAAVMLLDQWTFDAWANQQSSPMTARPFAGLGDQAFEVAGMHFEVLFVRRGDTRAAFEVAAGLGSFFGPEERLARIVVPRLPA
jgi:hypothetical protein